MHMAHKRAAVVLDKPLGLVLVDNDALSDTETVVIGFAQMEDGTPGPGERRR
jgi:hypothetical protein